MIELRKDRLEISFPEVHKEARASVNFQRTLRIPDDGQEYFLPPGLGSFPLRHVDDHAARVPASWIRHGGVMLPMYQSEALWIFFEGRYPMAIKVATGKIDAVTGETWSDGLDEEDQNYVVTPDQPWLDGYCVEEGIVRQFVAMPLGAGYTAEEQITGEAEFGGLQIVAYPMKAKAWKKYGARVERVGGWGFDCMASGLKLCAGPEMGLAPGGRMRQDIYDDPHDFDVWDVDHSSRCFVHITNSLTWRSITGQNPPGTPLTAAEYTRAGLPWFDYYDADAKALEGSSKLAKLLSVARMGKLKNDVPLPENESVDPERIVQLRRGLRKEQVREGRF